MAANQAQVWLRCPEMCGKFASGTKLCAQREPHTVPKASNRREQRYSLEGVDRLTQEYRRVLLLDHFEDYPQQDIARFLGLTQSTVKWPLLRARQSLKVKLEEVFYSREALSTTCIPAIPAYSGAFRGALFGG